MLSGEDFSAKQLKALEKRLSHVFQDKNLLKTAFTHRSWANENGGEDNERLEFLGDAVLELLSSEKLYENCPSDEGELTRLRQQIVSREALEEASDRANLMQDLRFCGKENNVGGKTKSNLFESALGAIYLDGGIDAARAFCDKYLRFTERENFRSLLQELVQEETKGIPQYETTEKDGEFQSVVRALGKEAKGMGQSKQAAETEAARALLQKLKEGKRH